MPIGNTDLPIVSLVLLTTPHKSDDPGQIGLEGEVSESAIDGTSSNMQDKVLESAIYPWVQVGARFASAQSDPLLADAHLAIGVILQEQDNTAGALAAYKRYLELAPDGLYADSIRRQSVRLASAADAGE